MFSFGDFRSISIWQYLSTFFVAQCPRMSLTSLNTVSFSKLAWSTLKNLGFLIFFLKEKVFISLLYRSVWRWSVKMIQFPTQFLDSLRFFHLSDGKTIQQLKRHQRMFRGSLRVFRLRQIEQYFKFVIQNYLFFLSMIAHRLEKLFLIKDRGLRIVFVILCHFFHSLKPFRWLYVLFKMLDIVVVFVVFEELF